MGRLFTVLFALIVVAALAAAWGYREFHQPGPLDRDKIVLVPKGSGLNAIAEQMRAEGVIEYPLLFVAGVRLAEQGRALRAGEYEIPAAISAKELMDLLVSGKVVIHRLTAVEGTTVAQVMDAVRAETALDGEITSVPPEGMILAETYHFTRGDQRQTLVDRMRAAMTETLDELWPKRDPDIPVKSREEAVTLASIVEKETGVPAERARIAGVYANRLRIGMRLQADPTVAYGLADGNGTLDRPLTRADLDTANPYNTYLNSGLPPGPIAIPSRASLEAVLNPMETKDLYFVADGSGGHAFAETLAEHNRNVANWRRHQRQQAQ